MGRGQLAPAYATAMRAHLRDINYVLLATVPKKMLTFFRTRSTVMLIGENFY